MICCRPGRVAGAAWGLCKVTIKPACRYSSTAFPSRVKSLKSLLQKAQKDSPSKSLQSDNVEKPLYETQKPQPGDKIYIAMSGGVDSSVAAMILKENYGPEMLQPVFVETWNPYLLTPLTKLERNRPYNRANVSLKPIARDEKCGEKDFQRVKEIADFMGLPEPIRMDFHRRYWNDVFEPMLRAYAEGLTPNPDLACNAHVKFGELMTQLILKVKYMAESERPKKVWLATGHYARVARLNKFPYYHHLLKSADPIKDQTYFLASISPATLRYCMFPLGDLGLTKDKVYEMAETWEIPGFRPGQKRPRESAGLCFVEPQRSFQKLLDEFIMDNPGYYVAGPNASPGFEDRVPEGMILGKHRGMHSATIGEKSHLELAQGYKPFAGRWYVSRKFPKENYIEVVKGGDHPRLKVAGVTATKFDWLEYDCEEIVLKNGPALQFKWRHEPKIYSAAIIRKVGSGNGKDLKLEIIFKKRQKGLCPGQPLVFYDGERVLGSAMITDLIDETDQVDLDTTVAEKEEGQKSESTESIST